MKKEVLQSIKIIVLGLVLGLGVSMVSAEWTPPPGTPSSTNNASAPLNVGESQQNKDGNLIIGANKSAGLLVNGPVDLKSSLDVVSQANFKGMVWVNNNTNDELVLIGNLPSSPPPSPSGSQGFLNKNNSLAQTEQKGFFARLSEKLGVNNTLKTNKAFAQNSNLMLFTVSPSNLSTSGPVTFTWNVPSDNNCTAWNDAGNSGWTGSYTTSGTKSVQVTKDTTFYFECRTENPPIYPKIISRTVTISTTYNPSPSVPSGTNNKLIVNGNSFLMGKVTIPSPDDLIVGNSNVCLENGINCYYPPVAQFGGTFSKSGSSCEFSNPLTGGCSCPTGFTPPYQMGVYAFKDGNGNLINQTLYGCYKTN